MPTYYLYESRNAWMADQWTVSTRLNLTQTRVIAEREGLTHISRASDGKTFHRVAGKWVNA
jgi:hypothetical protein